MKSYIDKNNLYLKKYLAQNDLVKFTSTWLFFDKDNIPENTIFFDHSKKIYSFLWEYSDESYPLKIDEWKRAFKRRNITTPSNNNIYKYDFVYSKRKVYLDIIETNIALADETFKNFTAFNEGEQLAQIVTEKNVDFLNLELNFLDIIDPINRFTKFIRILNMDEIYSIVLSGYHHSGKLIKVFIHRRNNEILTDENILSQDLFENTFVSRAFNWESSQ